MTEQKTLFFIDQRDNRYDRIDNVKQMAQEEDTEFYKKWLGDEKIPEGSMEIGSNLFLEQSKAIPEQPRKQFKYVKKILKITSNIPIKIYLLEEYIGTYKYKGENKQLKSEIFECSKDCTGGVGIGDPLELSEKELNNYTFEIINNPLRLGGKFKGYKTKTKGKLTRKSKKRQSRKYKKRSRKYKKQYRKYK